MKTDRIGIYVHIPFCIRKCRYCDFCSFDALSPETRKAYLSALREEILAFPKTEDEVASVFFGGGTPSLLSEKEAESILFSLSNRFTIPHDAEITLEANPASANLEKLRAFRALGFNRLSVGVQSFDESDLRTLGRVHTAEEARSFLSDARVAGFENLNIDLIYAIPGSDASRLSETLRTAVSFSPEHISAYGLILEEGTDFYKNRDSLRFYTEDEEADAYDAVRRFLAENGYHHYEISNYAKAGRECVHNLGYWQSRPYIGFGVSAYSLYGGKRYGNTRDLAAYCASPLNAVAEIEEMTGENDLYDTVMMALRTSYGIEDKEFRDKFGYDFYASNEEKLRPFLARGLVRHENGRTFLTEEGFYLSDAVLSAIL